jgi:polyisoprenoid-binding protein YceI
MNVHTFVLQISNTKNNAMKKVIFAAALVLGATQVMAQKPATTAATPAMSNQWAVDPVHSAVKFNVDHLVISEVDGNFKKFNGTVVAANATDFNNAKVTFTADVNSVNTDNADRDKHLMSDDFFAAEKYPQMSFTSTAFKKVKGNMYSVTGDLTIHGVTKHVTFAVNYGGTVKDPWGNMRAGFKAAGTINRKDFGLKWSNTTEAGGAIVGDEVRLQLNLEFIQQKA